jgi:hypothetical protein
MTTLKVTTLNGKPIGYSDDTEFVVQISRNRNAKSSYQNRYIIKGDLGKAVFYYNWINIGLGYRKRLLMPSAKKSILARQSS